jgi:hypothetical protein
MILEGSEPVHGQVVDAGSGRALPNVQACWWGYRFGFVASSDPKGRFVLPRMPRTPQLFAVADGYGPLVLEVPKSHGSSPESLLRIEMKKRGCVTGRLLDGDGTPLVHAAFLAQVTAQTPSGSSFPGMALEFETDERGVFAIGGASARGGVKGWVRVDGTWVRFCDVTSAKDVDLGDIRIAPIARVAGRIRDIDGSPASGVKVFVQPLDQPSEPSLGDKRVVYADTSGRFEMPGLLPGRFRINTYSPRSLACSVDVTAALDAEPIEIELEKAETIHGVVLSRVGEPQAGAVVSYYPHPLQQVLQVSPPTTMTDALGQFTLPCIWGDVEYRPHAMKMHGENSWQSESRPVTPGTHDIEIRFR